MNKFKITKVTSHSAVDHAAEELKKYLRMMMPDCGDILISRGLVTDGGFVLGVLDDLGIDAPEVEDPSLDDLIYIDVEADGGIIGGSNPRSVLISVYEYLRQCGCRWLFPGVDGEYIPISENVPVKYRHKPTMRYRGLCNEGAEYQSGMYDIIDFLPKVGMNAFMLEFFIPLNYYARYYEHEHNSMNRPPEPVSKETVLQWRRATEDEILRRGLLLHDVGHGFCTESFGIDSSRRATDGDNDSLLTDEQRSKLALVDGKRGLSCQVAKITQFCMSNPTARKEVVEFVTEYARKSAKENHIHVWLGDGVNNQCECEECVKKTTSDWYVILLNEIDESLSRNGIDTKIVFITYGDTTWAPEEEKIKNQDRFTCLFAPIARDFSKPLRQSTLDAKAEKYKRNENELPTDFNGIYANLSEWRRTWGGSVISYDYHFWRHQYYDPSGLHIAKNVCEDIGFYKDHNILGVIEDGSQRSFFPTGFAFYVYARTLYDADSKLSDLAEDYFSTAFGEDWRKFYAYLEEIGEVFNFEFIEGRGSEDEKRSPYYSPKRAEEMARIDKILESGRELIEKHYNSDLRVRTVSVRLLERHARYCRLLSDALIPKALGKDGEASAAFEKMKSEMGKEEKYIEALYDHGLAFHGLKRIFECKTLGIADIIY